MISFSQDILNLFGDYSLGRLTWLEKYIEPECDQPRWIMLCESVMFYIAGPEDKGNLNQVRGDVILKPSPLHTSLFQTRIPVYLAHNPDDTSMKDIVHFGQMVRSKKMRKYDYGFFQNWKRYGQVAPTSCFPRVRRSITAARFSLPLRNTICRAWMFLR